MLCCKEFQRSIQSSIFFLVFHEHACRLSKVHFMNVFLRLEFFVCNNEMNFVLVLNGHSIFE